MYPSTEDLLTLRDGDAADAEKLARLRAASGTAHAVARLDRMRDALRALPELEPPAGAWEAIETRLAAPAPRRIAARGAVAARLLGLAAALVLAVIAVLSVTSPPSLPTTSAPPQSPSGSALDLRATSAGGAAVGGDLLGDTLRTVRERLDRTIELRVARGNAVDGYASLEQQSAALEQMLGEITFQRAAMSGATASALAGLEDRIATIDAFLVSPALSADIRTKLMRARVELLEALVSVRLAQAQPLPF